MRYFVAYCLLFIVFSSVVYGQNSSEYTFSPQLAMSGNGQILAISGRMLSDPTARSGRRFPVDFFDATNGNILASYQGSQDDILGLSLNIDGSLLAYNNSYGELRVVNTETLNEVSELMVGGFADIGYAEWNPVGDSLIAYFGTILNIYTSNPLSRANAFSDSTTSEILGFDWSSNGNYVAYTSRLVADSQGVVEILSVNPQTELTFYKRFNVPASLAVAINLDGSFVATATTDGILITDVTAETQIPLTNNITDSAIVSLAWNPDSIHIAGGGNGFINIWDVNTRELIETIHTISWVQDIIWSPNGQYIYHSGGIDGVYRNGIPLEEALVAISCTFTITDTPALLSAITSANASPEADTICLEEGTYTLTSANNTSDGATGLPVITSNITLHGLGAGAVITRQSGSLAFRILNVASGGNLVLENLTISGGDAGSGSGGGIRNRGTLELVNTIIENNRGNGGGGIRNNDNATLIVTDSTIISNISTSSGGGIYSNTGSITHLTDTVISGNQANTSSGLGGGLFMNGAELTLSGGSFGANQARNGAGLFINATTQPVTITNTQFINNNATNHGGGLYASVGTISLDGVSFIGNVATNIGGAIRNGTNMTITNSTFSTNNGGASGGGGIANFGTLALNTSTLDGNLVSTSSGNGGGIFNQGTLSVNGGIIQNSSARNGAGLFSDGGSALVDGVQIMTNTASNQGGGVYFNGVVANSHVHGSCITGNTAPTGSAAYSAVANFNATSNWWGANGSSGLVNNNVNASNPLASCDPLMGSQSLMVAPQNNNTMQQSGTTQVVSLPYSNAFDSALGWIAQGAWSRESIGGQTGATWVADASVRGLQSILETNFALDLPRNRTATLRFWQSGTLSAEDRVILEILPQGATTWVLVNEQIGLNANWGQREVSLANWRGQQVRLRWRILAGSDTTTGIEYRLDELGVTAR